MSEPSAAATETTAPASTPEPAAAGSRQEIERIRASEAFQNDRHPEHEATMARLIQAYRQFDGEPDGEHLGEASPPSSEAPPSEKIPQRLNVLVDPNAEPQTAADLAQIPLPELDARSGLAWDTGKLEALYQTAEREDLVPLIRDGLHVARALAGQPVWNVEDTAAELDQHWGRAAPSMWAFATEAWNLLEAAQPSIAADLTRRGIRYHPDFGKFLARVGERMVDATTPGGERRLRAKYADRTGG